MNQETKNQIMWLKDEIKIAKLQNNIKALNSLQKELDAVQAMLGDSLYEIMNEIEKHLEDEE